MFFGKPFEYWATLGGMILYVGWRDAENDLMGRRLAKIGASALLAFGIGPSLSPYLWNSENAATVIIMSVGLLVLDGLTKIFSDRAFIRKLLLARFATGDKDDPQ